MTERPPCASECRMRATLTVRDYGNLPIHRRDPTGGQPSPWIPALYLLANLLQIKHLRKNQNKKDGWWQLGLCAACRLTINTRLCLSGHTHSSQRGISLMWGHLCLTWIHFHQEMNGEAVNYGVELYISIQSGGQ